ncbi:MAG TPA: outer membrane protein assembly factor BamD [Nevskiaceae bacterium]|nr:outer membrane protein assembly factor BamD [Nevskiaceae bacterium]
MKIAPRVLAALAVLVLAGCASDPDRPAPTAENVFGKDIAPGGKKANREDRFSAEQLYRSGRAALDAADFQGAIEQYDKVTLRFPFSDFATQSELERIYAQYRIFEPDKALSAADRFLREHPRHPAVDYVQYVKGLVNFSRDDSALSFLPGDDTKSDVTSQRRAFDDFQVLLQKYPSSRYAGDAWQRMVFIRNRLAEHELHVVDFYVRRGAYMAAAKRAEQIISLYPGTAASYSALEALADCYQRAGLQAQAADARKLIAVQQRPQAAIPVEPGHRSFFARVSDFFTGKNSSEELPTDQKGGPAPPPAPAQTGTATAPPETFYDETPPPPPAPPGPVKAEPITKPQPEQAAPPAVPGSAPTADPKPAPVTIPVP